MPTRLPTPPPSPTTPQLILCADGGGSKVCVVVRSEDGVEVRGYAGPCNVQSVGYTLACQSILLATYRALAQLPRSYLPGDFYIPPVECSQVVTPVAEPAAGEVVVGEEPGAGVGGIPLPHPGAHTAQLPSPPSSLESTAPPVSHAGDGNAIHHLPAVMTHLSLAASGPAPSVGVDGLSPFGSRAVSPSLELGRGHGHGQSHSHSHSTSSTSRSHSSTPTRPNMPPLNLPIFRYAWLGLAGIQSKADEKAFQEVVAGALGVGGERVKVSNDVNLLAAPALDIPEIDHVVAVVAGTGTVGRTIRVSGGLGGVGGKGKKRQGLPLEDVAVSRGWGYLLCDEGSAFWIGRLAIRSLLTLFDRLASSGIYSPCPSSTSTPKFNPLHEDLMEYFGTRDPGELIGVASLVGGEELGVGEATSRRNALIAGAARVVFRWAFPENESQRSEAGEAGSVRRGRVGLPTPPGSTDGGVGDSDSEAGERGSVAGTETEVDVEDPDPTTTTHPDPTLIAAAHTEALHLAHLSIAPLIQLTLSLLGDRSVVQPPRAALTLGGGLMMCEGYREMLLEGLEKEGVRFGRVVVVKDAAGEGARGLGRVEWE